MAEQDDQRAQARDAFRLANDIMLDVITATRAHETFELWFQISVPTEVVRVGVNRLCLFYSCVTLYKWLEWHDRYARFIPEHTRIAAKALKKELEGRGLRALRNKYIGHIWDDDSKRPLTTPDVDAYVEAIVGPDIPAFFRWLNHPDTNSFPQTVVSVIEGIKDGIQAAWNFDSQDIRS